MMELLVACVGILAIIAGASVRLLWLVCKRLGVAGMGRVGEKPPKVPYA